MKPEGKDAIPVSSLSSLGIDRKSKPRIVQRKHHKSEPQLWREQLLLGRGCSEKSNRWQWTSWGSENSMSSVLGGYNPPSSYSLVRWTRRNWNCISHRNDYSSYEVLMIRRNSPYRITFLPITKDNCALRLFWGSQLRDNIEFFIGSKTFFWLFYKKFLYIFISIFWNNSIIIILISITS